MMRILFLAARTSRSQAYAQALAHAGLTLEVAVVFDDGRAPAGPSAKADWPASPVMLPDLSVPLEATLDGLAAESIHVAAANVNDPRVLEAVSGLRPDLVVYSGYGGQIVGSGLLDLGVPFLHLHSGILPAFRGSTTVYYSLLANGRCGVSAIFLNAAIDRGRIVAKRDYPPPAPGVDIDHVYDNAIRADLLTRVLASMRTDGLPGGAAQDDRDAITYYVIHPVLKHLAILSL